MVAEHGSEYLSVGEADTVMKKVNCDNYDFDEDDYDCGYDDNDGDDNRDDNYDKELTKVWIHSRWCLTLWL